jgi:hypothetical protein
MAGDHGLDRATTLRANAERAQHQGMTETHDVHAVASGGGVASARLTSRHYIASQHLWPAQHHARLYAEAEVERSGKAHFDIRHRAYSIGGVLSALGLGISTRPSLDVGAVVVADRWLPIPERVEDPNCD